MAHKISVCIICKERVPNLEGYMSKFKFKDLADEFIVVNVKNTGLNKTVPSWHKNIGTPIIFLTEDEDLQQSLLPAIQKAKSEWIFVIKSNELLTSTSSKLIRGLVGKKNESAYYVTCRYQTKYNDSDTGKDIYEWVGNLGKYRSPNTQKYNWIAQPEVRLFRKNVFKDILFQNDGSISPVFNKELSAIPMSGLRIYSDVTPVEGSEKHSKKQNLIQDYERCVNNPEEELSQYEGFEFIAPNNFGYSILDDTNYLSIIDGLEMGWGHVDILKFMLVDLIEHGDYDKVADFSSAITDKLGDLFEVWHLRGDAFFYRLDLENAKICYEKALSIKEGNATVLQNLSRIYILGGEHDKARKVFQTLKHTGKAPTHEIDFVLSAIEKKQEEIAKLSLLMICKDEEDYIARALGSIKDIVDEMIIVDTGSRDRTRTIAESFGAKVIIHPWNDHFSEARNAGLKLVTGDYVLWMDADEYVNREDQIRLLVYKNLLSLTNKKGTIFQIETFKKEPTFTDPFPPDTIVKRTAIFPHMPGIRFSGRIFESVDESLKDLNIDFIVAENIRFLNISDNTIHRRSRIQHTIEQCMAEPLEPEAIFGGIVYWLDMGNYGKAEEWFERAIAEIPSRPSYDSIISRLAETLAHNGFFNIHSQYFKPLLTKYHHSYPLVSLCANMLYQAGSYRDAAILYEKLLHDKDDSLSVRIDVKKRRNDLVLFAASGLEIDNFKQCDEVIEHLANEENMYDAIQALHFYAEIRKKDLEKGIAILDSWIRRRKIEINETLNSIVDLTHIIVRMVETMVNYNQTNAAHILSRSCEYLIKSFKSGG